MNAKIIIILSFALLINAALILESVAIPIPLYFKALAKQRFSCKQNGLIKVDKDFHTARNLTRDLNEILIQLATINIHVDEEYEKIKDVTIDDIAALVPGPSDENIPSNLTIEEMFILVNDYTSILMIELNNVILSSVFDDIHKKFEFNPDHIGRELLDWLTNVRQIMRVHHINFECKKYVSALVKPNLLTSVDIRNDPQFYGSWLMHKILKVINFLSNLLNKGTVLCQIADVEGQIIN
ncbi:hypothetical protein RDWZM_000709 [Blomia tropicalis]|uniref:Uncharacterized protein n=1 Tax=Blomia tropicalis TaxID=40697 RepID=A0A9Q0MAS1_BLOTA|nr:hypothetical protein RDWZM_000709 [Blomia tropicalis]